MVIKYILSITNYKGENNKMRNEKVINIESVFRNMCDIKNNIILEGKKTSAIILEKICNESIITKDFLKSISLEDIEMARNEICEEDSTLIKELQKSTFLETIINKSNSLKTLNSEDFF